MSNFLQVPSQRRDSRGVYEKILKEQMENLKREQAERDFYTRLVTQAPFIPGNSEDLVTFGEIDWINDDLVKESITFHKRFFAHEILAMMVAVVFGFAVKPSSAVVLKSRSGRLEKNEFYEKHLSTVQRIIKFFNFKKNPDQAYGEILTIRKLHRDAAITKFETGQSITADLKTDEPWKTLVVKAIKKDLDFVDTSEAPEHLLQWEAHEEPMSQFDMVTNQASFWIFMWMFPRFSGIKKRETEMRGVIHVWGIFGRLLGIQDKFNVCLAKPEEAVDLFEKLFKNVFLSSLKSIDESVVTIQDTFVTAWADRLPIRLITYKALMYFVLRQVKDFKGTELWKLMTWRDKVCVRFLQIFFFFMRHSWWFRTAVNLIVYGWFQLQALLYLPTSKLWSFRLPRYLKNSITLKLY